ncbi:MAG TPA: vanadium-dependent haloperoxidase [Verrucomicrobiota bacterium]|nr:hypothetical protein [Verrucomicrobiales bacterium]HRI16750.1 vanadium-dependent haloperoxidase [Verrucomicrobiota bacterium]
MKTRRCPVALLLPWARLTLGLFVSAPVVHGNSIARVWDEEILAAIRVDLPHPPAHARNLFHLSVAMYDAWAAYDPVAVGYVYREKHSAGDVAAARREAISYAAYNILKERYALSKNAATTLPALSSRMLQLGYFANNQTTDTNEPAGVGNRIAAAVSAFCINDGARQLQGYADFPPDQGGWVSVNPWHVVLDRLPLPVEVNHWQPLTIAVAFTQNGIPISSDQKYLGPHWRDVRPFALTRSDSSVPWLDPGAPPRLGGVGDADFRSQVVEVIRLESLLTPDNSEVFDLSPGAYGNNSLGANDGQGHPVNPVTGQPYAPQLVKRGDFGRVLAEFWADGPNSETPPGHWNTIANGVVDHPSFHRQIGGIGPELDELEWDVKMYFALNASVHDAACVAWTTKRFYNGARPIGMIRYMGSLGQSSDPTAPSYHENGLPLVPGLIELVTAETAAAGGRHAGLAVGSIAVLAWPGQPSLPSLSYSGVRWIAATNWSTYQKSTFVTPAFPGYISGHSTFSRAAAEVLTAMTGSPYFPGGLGEFVADQNFFLTFEKGPSETIRLQWATYYDAADQAGQSRLYGGIHVQADDFGGRRAGSVCGKEAWELARTYFDGSIAERPFAMRIAADNSIVCETERGFYYQLQVSKDLMDFADEPGGPRLAQDTTMVFSQPEAATSAFCRIVRRAVP